MISTDRLKEGDLVEIALKSNAVHCKDGFIDFYLEDLNLKNRTYVPGRYHTGYVVNIADNTIFLNMGWDKAQNHSADNSIKIGFHLGAIKYYRRLKKSDWTETVRE
jgi:hypothetical protein